MSHNNSKNRKSNFSNSSSSNAPASSGSDPSTNMYTPSFKPQAPPSQAPHYYNKPGYPQNPNAPSYPDYSKTSNTSSEAMNLPNYGMSYMAFYPQAQPPQQSNQGIAPPPRGSNPMEVQQPQYGNFYNMPQGYLFAPGYQSGYMDQGFSQQDLNSGMMGMSGMGQGYMQEETAGQREKMEVVEGYGDSDKNTYPKRQRKEQEERSSEFDLVQKKTKTENLYQQRLEILANELAKIKETEISIIHQFLNSPHPNVNNLKARKDLEALLVQKGVISQTPLLTSNLVVQSAVVSLPHEALRTMFASLVNAKIKEAAELEQMKKDHLKEVRKEEEQMKNGDKMEADEEPLCKVIHVSTQQFYQAEPAMKDLEDKLDRLEHVLREKRAKLREATKKIGDTQVGLAISQTKYEIATRRLEEMGLSTKMEEK